MRLTPGNASQMTEALLDRLDQLEGANITVVVPAGPHWEIIGERGRACLCE